MGNRHVGLSAILIVVAIFACLALANSTQAPQKEVQENMASTGNVLPSVEINDYEGSKLDAVASEPENSIKGLQNVDVLAYRLSVSGKVADPLSLTYDQVVGMPSYRQVTTLNCVEGWSVTYLWQGVRIKDLLAEAGYDSTAKVVVFRCYDGYSTSLALDYVIDNDILLAYKMNGITMPPKRGFPFQVVAQDKYGYKWAKWVTGIEVLDDSSFLGYWESRGYDNTADIPEK